MTRGGFYFNILNTIPNTQIPQRSDLGALPLDTRFPLLPHAVEPWPDPLHLFHGTALFLCEHHRGAAAKPVVADVVQPLYRFDCLLYTSPSPRDS